MSSLAASQDFNLIEALSRSQRDERITRGHDGIARWIGDEVAIRFFYGDDDDAESLSQMAGMESDTVQLAAGLDERLLDLQIQVLGARGQLDEIDDGRPQDRHRHLGAADDVGRDDAAGAGAEELLLGLLALTLVACGALYWALPIPADPSGEEPAR